MKVVKDGQVFYAVVGVVVSASSTNPNFVVDFTESYSRAEALAQALNGGPR
ncbi:hypothetical protein [Micromonospora tulbaghiae]|uniref:hypothetical protein n=1 Tax=Micromonospora tulbaghiae TaxID=479978 RepID=UPI0013C4F58A|nr:hypothetical protein [Micromonospora tulbaghiae]